ncbi:MAG: acyl-ACP thioesterase [Candidatus Azotimanducaceae bacterium]
MSDGFGHFTRKHLAWVVVRLDHTMDRTMLNVKFSTSATMPSSSQKVRMTLKTYVQERKI